MQSGTTAPPLAAALAIAIALAAGCGSVGPRVGLPPLSESTLDATEHVFRPLFRYREDAALDRVECDYLFPLGYYEREGRDIHWHLYPLIQWNSRVNDQGFSSTSFMLTPLVIGGNHIEEGAYLTVLPFGGTLKRTLGKQYIAHVLFPLFAYTRQKEFEQYHILFPLLGWRAGRGNEGFRFLPFYAHAKRTSPDGVVLYDRTSILWPFFTWERNDNNARNPWTSWVIFPFYGEVRSPAVDETYLLWPFFKKLEDKRAGFVDWRLPFPFVWISTGTKSRFDLWPIAGHLEYGGYRRWFALWPIFRRERHETDAMVERDFWALPFYWDVDRVYKSDGATEGHLKVWPFFRVDRRRDGGYGFHALSLLWFREENRFEEVISPLWELVRYKEDGKGKNDLRLLFNMFRREWKDDEAPGPDESSWEVLGGLVGHRSRGEEGTVKILWFFEF